jgi:hypothetical protein
MPVAGLVREARMRRKEGPQGGGLCGPLDWRNIFPFEAEVAAHTGFSDQSQFSCHFKRLVGVAPG